MGKLVDVLIDSHKDFCDTVSGEMIDKEKSQLIAEKERLERTN